MEMELAGLQRLAWQAIPWCRVLAQSLCQAEQQPNDPGRMARFVTTANWLCLRAVQMEHGVQLLPGLVLPRSPLELGLQVALSHPRARFQLPTQA